MQVGDPTPITSALTPAQILPVRPIVRQTGEDRATERDRREGAHNDDDRASFRATLDAALPEDIVASFATWEFPRNEVAAETPRAEKRPTSADLEIDARESSKLFADAQNASGPAYDGFSEIPAAAVQQFRDVTHRYARSFFSVGGTFAARGDRLEVSA